MSDIKLGFAICGSFCTFDKILKVISGLREQYDITPILSEAACGTDTRFGKADEFVRRVEEVCGKKAIKSITEAEPIGPKKLVDVIVVAPCTGNTLAKLSQGITDTSITMACKAQLRNKRPVVLAVSTNDGLSGSAANIGMLMNRKDVYFVPYRQDDPRGKPNSLVADFGKIAEAVEQAVHGKQLQPLLLTEA